MLLEFTIDKYGLGCVEYAKKRMPDFKHLPLEEPPVKFQIHTIILEEYYILSVRNRMIRGLTGLMSTVLDKNLTAASLRLTGMYEDLNLLVKQKGRPDAKGGSLGDISASYHEARNKDKKTLEKEEVLLHKGKKF